MLLLFPFFPSFSYLLLCFFILISFFMFMCCTGVYRICRTTPFSRCTFSLRSFPPTLMFSSTTPQPSRLIVLILVVVLILVLVQRCIKCTLYFWCNLHLTVVLISGNSFYPSCSRFMSYIDDALESEGISGNCGKHLMRIITCDYVQQSGDHLAQSEMMRWGIRSSFSVVPSDLRFKGHSGQFGESSWSSRNE